KTLLNIEGLGRQLDPDLDLWATAKPYLERWMSEQIGWRALVERVRQEAPYWSTTLPQLPRLLHQALVRLSEPRDEVRAAALLAEMRRRNGLLAVIVALLVLIASWLIIAK
ncbi:MAG TPA: ubiquinone biosynthesis regulatory protein kinase UbiB, partial [Burkholderiales bacterium]|nr:ubiquinone biosynthesis regulatory protein kinase UbiB [Burkholderiales bacterium]